MLRSLSRSFAALFILFVRPGYPNLARGVLAEIRSHYARPPPDISFVSKYVVPSTELTT